MKFEICRYVAGTQEYFILSRNERKSFCIYFQDRVDRRGRPIANNNDAEIRNLQQEIADKNKV